MMRKLIRSALLFGAAAHLSVLPLAATVPTALAQATLPAPYVSRAFDAVVLPIDDSVRSAFALDAAANGVLVLAVAPDGVAAQSGVEPGDIIHEIKGKDIASPIELDEVVYFWLTQSVTDFSVEYYRAGVLASTDLIITMELYEAALDVATVSTWTSWTYEGFSYEEYTVEYSEEIVESYEESETTIEETVTSEEFSSEVIEDSEEDEAADDGEDGVDDGDADDGGEDDGGEDDGGEDDGGDDDGGDDDGGGDDGGDDGDDGE
jgi:membrane-associated protease RseP (regulator of RpoE activity)